MNKIAIITDTHAGARNDASWCFYKQKQFYENIFFPELQRRQTKKLWHLGDFFDKRKHISFDTLYNIRNSFLEPLKEMNIEMEIIIGNHDMFHKNTLEINSIDLLLNHYDNITIYDKITEKEYDNHKVLWVPWLVNETDKSFQNTNATHCNRAF